MTSFLSSSIILILSIPIIIIGVLILLIIEKTKKNHLIKKELADNIKSFSSEIKRLKQENELLMHKTSNKVSDKKEPLFIIEKEKNEILKNNLERTNKELDNLKRGKGIKSLIKTDNSFLDNTIHEIRNVVSLIIGSLNELSHNYNTTNNEKDIFFLSAYRNTLTIQDLTDQLTVDAKYSEKNEDSLQVARYDIIHIIRQVKDLFTDWIEITEIDFSIQTKYNKLWVWIDRQKIEFILRILVTNILKESFTSPQIAIKIEIEKRKFLNISIQNNNIEQEKLNKNRGLQKVKNIIEMHKGTIVTDNKRNIYIISLPLGKAHLLSSNIKFISSDKNSITVSKDLKEKVVELLNSTKVETTIQQHIKKKNMLIIDDDIQIRWYLNRLFNKEYNIILAKNGQEGINIALKEKPDIILCDIVMPIKNGFETCKELKSYKETAYIPIIMLTAKAEKEYVIAGINGGADVYITKPFEVNPLKNKIKELIYQREELKENLVGFAIPKTPISSHNNSNENLKNNFLSLMAQTIEAHINEANFDSKRLAEEMNMSLPTLYRKVKKFSNYSVLELMRNIRLKKAAELILTQKYNIREVSEMVGFNDLPTFRKRFIEQHGVTPSHYALSKLKEKSQ